MQITEETRSVPRPEYPRPQFVRPDWLCLNGTWQFEIDQGDSGLERGLRDRPLTSQILVPFCPESNLSGVAVDDFLNAVWYRRSVRAPAAWAGRRLLLHFGAVDYDTTVWANGVEVGRHRGGFTSFSLELTGVVQAGEEFTLVVRARDPGRGAQARGKQSRAFGMFGPIYGRTTGIWQTVWLEPVPQTYLRRPRITPELAGGGAFGIELPLAEPRAGLEVTALLSDDEGEIASASAPTGLDLTPRLHLPIPADRRRLWEPGDPFLYDLRLELRDGSGTVIDRLDSYAGLRAVAIDGHAVTLNGRPRFQRLVLDQGYYPDGIMTAPDDTALVQDIELSLAAGFNGARLHQKIFEERFLYHADRLGYLVWGEFPDWGHDVVDGQHQPDVSYAGQWLESVERDYSHPAIVGWCPLNETPQAIGDRITVLDDITRALFLAAKAADTSRPVLDASGYSHRVPETDIYDSHDYEQDPATFARHMASLGDGHPYTNQGHTGAWSVPYRGQPYFCSEFGGIWWAPDASERSDSWGYGTRPKSEAEFYQRFEGLVKVLLDNPDMFGYCYTQLTDVFQEQNGIYRFDRTRKLDVERIRAIQRRPAAIERLEPARNAAENLRA